MSGTYQRWISLLGRRDDPTDGVAYYCAYPGATPRFRGYELEIVRACHGRNESGVLGLRICGGELKIGAPAEDFLLYTTLGL